MRSLCRPLLASISVRKKDTGCNIRSRAPCSWIDAQRWWASQPRLCRMLFLSGAKNLALNVIFLLQLYIAHLRPLQLNLCGTSHIAAWAVEASASFWHIVRRYQHYNEQLPPQWNRKTDQSFFIYVSIIQTVNECRSLRIMQGLSAKFRISACSFNFV